MHSDVKLYADKRDMKELKYIFVDCLDVDPTFENFREDFEYCKRIPGLLEEHIELTPVRKRESDWNIEYWNALKIDLLKNFSRERFQHMVEVAQVVHADKIRRIEEERRQRNRNVLAPEPTQSAVLKVVGRDEYKPSAKKPSEIQSEKVEEARRKLASENKKAEEERARQEKQRLEEERVKREKQSRITGEAKPQAGENEIKKVMGVALAIIIVIAIIVVLIKLQQESNPLLTMLVKRTVE